MKVLVRCFFVVLFILIGMPVRAQFDAVKIHVCITRHLNIKHEIEAYCRLLDEEGEKYIIRYVESRVINCEYKTTSSHIVELTKEDFNRIAKSGLALSSSDLFSEMNLGNCIIIDDGSTIDIRISVGMAFSVTYHLSWPYTGQTDENQDGHNQVLTFIVFLCQMIGLDENVLLW